MATVLVLEVPVVSSRVPPGAMAPDLCLPAAAGGSVGLADYRGRASVVLVFLRSSA